MANTNVRKGLYWSDRTRTWHYEFRFRGRKSNGDTGIGSTRGLAERWLIKFKESLALREVGLEAPAVQPTLNAIVTDYLLVRAKDLSAHTLATARLRLRLHWGDLADLPADQITSAKAEDMRTTYLAGPGRRSKGGANRVVNSLRDVLSWAVRRGMIPEMPFKLKKLKPQEKPRPILWPEQVLPFLRAVESGDKAQKILAERNPHAHLACMLMVGLGLREGEALSARWEWVNWRNQSYTVGAAKNRKLREIAMPDYLVTALKALPNRAVQGLLLPADDKGAQHMAGYARKPVSRGGRALGIVGLSPHRLRAAFATAHFEAGTELSQIQQMMGHEDPHTTLRYIEQRPRGQAESQAKVAQRMKLQPVPQKSPKKTKQTSKPNQNVA